MNFQLIFQPETESALVNLKLTDPKKYRKVLKTLALSAIPAFTLTNIIP